jgi:hypothetical protein
LVVGLCDESSRKVKIIEGIVIIAVVPEMECCCILSGNAHTGWNFFTAYRTVANQELCIEGRRRTASGASDSRVALLSSCLTARRRHAWVLAGPSAESAQMSRYNLKRHSTLKLKKQFGGIVLGLISLEDQRRARREASECEESWVDGISALFIGTTDDTNWMQLLAQQLF